MIYLSGSINDLRHPKLGFLITPDSNYLVPSDVIVAADNGRFTNPAGYSDERYLKFLERFPPDRTLWATAPDVLGDHLATVDQAVPVLRAIRALGLPAAFVAQDGWREETTPWDEMDALFVGGSTAFKFRGGRDAVQAAKRRGKLTHMGRVNSLRRLRAAVSIGCDSADGTFLRYAPDHNNGRMLRWFKMLEGQTEMELS